MTLHVDLYYTMRSPYCYLSTPQLSHLVAEYDLVFALKPVYPLAVSDPTFFQRVDPLFRPYGLKDTGRIAKRLNIPYRRPRPDPVVQDMETMQTASVQPYIRNLTCLAQAAAERGRGLEFVVSVSKLIFSPEVDGWNTGTYLEDAITAAGLDAKELEAAVKNETQHLESAIAENRKQQLAAGHWGAPLFVFEGETFFGQDRIVDLIWHLQNCGLESR